MTNPIKEKIRRDISCADYLIKSKGNLYECPKCGSGTGNNKTGAVKHYIETNTWFCHACGEHGDVIDLCMLKNNIDFNSALSLLAENIGIKLSPLKNDKQEFVLIDYRTYYAQCRQNLLQMPEAEEYLNSRGISLETALKFGVCYDPAADPANAPGVTGNKNKPHPCRRIIFPSGSDRYTGRSIDSNTPKAFEKINAKGSKAGIFNLRALQENNIVFITEGAFDALSIGEAGFPAVALNSASNASLLLKKIGSEKIKATLILALDADNRGQEAAQALREGLRELNVPFLEADICFGYKDPNEAIVADREKFIKGVEDVVANVFKPRNTLLYVRKRFLEDILFSKKNIKTGFDVLDEKSGGLFTGLYVVASITSLGKTSFVLQIADQIAETGEDVLFFSLEQSMCELVSKSISRKVAQEFGVNNAFINGDKRNINREYIEIYANAVDDRISIIEGNFNCDVKYIGDIINDYIALNKKRPVIIIDYLQIISSSAELGSKQSIDSIVTELKRISRELNITIIAVSSVNRANYTQPIDFESLKESGSIEFTADVIWGLQLECLNEELFLSDNQLKKRARIKEAKAANPRLLELVCLKNRHGESGYSCFFEYYPANDLFIEIQEAVNKKQVKTPKARVTV